MNKLPTLRQPSCFRCEHNYQYADPVAQKRNGVSMHFMERFCLAKKKARRFQKKDPITKVPDWCPKYIQPSTVRIFWFKDVESWTIYQMLCRSLGSELPPEAHHYALEKTATLDMRASAAHKLMVDGAKLDDLLQIPIALHSIVELSDGVQSACYYKTTQGYRYEPFFNVKMALQNQMEREDGAAE